MISKKAALIVGAGLTAATTVIAIATVVTLNITATTEPAVGDNNGGRPAEMKGVIPEVEGLEVEATSAETESSISDEAQPPENNKTEHVEQQLTTTTDEPSANYNTTELFIQSTTPNNEATTTKEAVVDYILSGDGRAL